MSRTIDHEIATVTDTGVITYSPKEIDDKIAGLGKVIDATGVGDGEIQARVISGFEALREKFVHLKKQVEIFPEGITVTKYRLQIPKWKRFYQARGEARNFDPDTGQNWLDEEKLMMEIMPECLLGKVVRTEDKTEVFVAFTDEEKDDLDPDIMAVLWGKLQDKLTVNQDRIFTTPSAFTNG